MQHQPACVSGTVPEPPPAGHCPWIRDGPKALIAELLGGEIGRLAELPVPEIVFAELPAELARTEHTGSAATSRRRSNI